jgi:catechol 2,3-dioxygenase-like lactoylglutathione lyase family enzyme
MRLAQHDDVVHALATDRSDQPLGKRVLPRMIEDAALGGHGRRCGFGETQLRAGDIGNRRMKKLEADGVKIDRPFTPSPLGGGLGFIVDPSGTYIELNERPKPL